MFFFLFHILSIATNLASADETSFCSDPVKFVCGDSHTLTAQMRENRVTAIEEKLKHQAIESTFSILSINLPSDKVYKESLLAKVKPRKLRQEAYKIYLEKLKLRIEEYMHENKVPSDYDSAHVKQILLSAIKNNSDISLATRTEMLRILDTVKLFSIGYSDIELSSGNENLEKIYKYCNKNFFEDNAFADTINNQAVVIICPGYIIASVEYSKSMGISPAYILAPMYATLGHEFAHHFDSSEFPNAYQFLENKLAAHNNELATDIKPYMREISADFWGNKVLNSHIEKIPMDYKNLIRRGAIEDMCDSITKTGTEHPSGKFRIEHLYTEDTCQ